MTASASTGDMRREPTAAEFRAMQSDPEFLKLKKTFRSFTFPVSVVFFLWFILYLLLATYAHDFMATPIAGNFNVGVLLGLLQFVSTFAITFFYIRYANRKIEPLSTTIRERMEGVC